MRFLVRNKGTRQVTNVKMDAFVAQLMAARGITTGELTELLGYRSKTSIARIVKEEAHQRSVEEFAARVRDIMNLSPAENEELEALLESSKWQSDYQASREMLAFLKGSPVHGDVCLEMANARGNVDLVNRYKDSVKIEITLLNSSYVPIFGVLGALIWQKNAHVRHYILVDDNTAKTIRSVNAMLTVFYETGYEGYVCQREDSDPLSQHYGIDNSDIMLVSYVAGDGQSMEDLIVFDRPDHGVVSAGVAGTYHSVVQLDFSSYIPIKRSYFECAALEDYAQYSRDYASLEYNRPVYKIKPDIGVDYIPADLMGKAVREGPWAEDENMRPIIKEILPELIEIYEKRVQNTFEKHKPAHTVMKTRAMRRFACTGKTTDHFWGMRPYTPSERKRIFTLLLKEYERNPFFNLYFLKDNDFLRDVEIAYYEGIGMLILESGTDYNLAEGHSEILITHPEFLRLYKDYFLKNLIKNHVLSREQTCQFLRECIAQCR